MNTNISYKNILTENNIINDSNKSNSKEFLNSILSEQIIFFKEDVLKDIK